MKAVNRVLFILHFFVGLGGLAGGFAAVSNPASPMGMPVEALKYSPFDDFLIPGLILMGFIGLGNIIAGIIHKFVPVLRGYVGGVMGGGLMIWIVVQCIMLRGVVALHVIFFIVGLVQAVTAAVVLYNDSLFPLNVLRKLLKN